MKMYSFSRTIITTQMNTFWDKYRHSSKGWEHDPPAKLHPRIMFGSGPMLTPEFVKQNNISHVINCAEDIDSPKWFRQTHPDKYMCLYAEDTVDSDITKWFPQFKECMNAFLAERSSSVVYVHCQCGINRSAFLTLLYLCLKFQFPFENTVRSMLIQRPCCLTNPVFRLQVSEYIKKHQ